MNTDNQPTLAERTGRLATLFREAAAAHHDAFQTTDGQDPEWPIWYASWLQDPVHDQTGLKMTRSQLVYCLMNANFAHEARDPDSDWAEFAARRIIETHGASDSPQQDRLALYYQPSCPYCRRVLKVLDELDVEVELRNIWTEPDHRDDLVEARGRQTVPVLWIQTPDGAVRWMPESQDIIDYLKREYGAI